MADENKIKIGGKEYPVKLYYYKVFDILKRYNKIYTIRRLSFEKENGRQYDDKTDKIFMPDKFFFWALFTLLDKRGFLFWKKPFRSVRHISKNILRDEAMAIVKFIGEGVLYTRTEAQASEAPEEKKNKK